MAELFGEVWDGDDLVLAVLEPNDAAGDDGDADVLEHEGIEGELYGIEREVFLGQIGKRFAKHTAPFAVEVVGKVGVGLVVKDYKTFGLTVAAIIIVEHIEGAGNLLTEVSLLAGILAAIDHCLIENEVHTRGHLVHELKDSLFLWMDWRKEAVLGHILSPYGRTDALRHSCTKEAEALAIGVRLGAEGCGTEGVLPPLLYPIGRCTTVTLCITSGLLLLVERLADETMGDIGDGRQGFTV